MSLIGMFRDEFSKKTTAKLIRNAADIVSKLTDKERRELLKSICVWRTMTNEYQFVPDSYHYAHENNIKTAVKALEGLNSIIEEHGEPRKISAISIIILLHRVRLSPDLISSVDAVLAFFTNDIEWTQVQFKKELEKHDKTISLDDLVDFRVDDERLSGATVGEIYVKPGCYVQEEEPVFELIAKNVSQDYKSTKDGVVRKIDIGEGQIVEMNTSLLTLEKCEIDEEESACTETIRIVSAQLFIDAVKRKPRLDYSVFFDMSI